jgi:hypothetical protein
MVAKTSIYYDIVTEFQNKGAKQAQQSMGLLEKSANSLGKKLAATFGAAALLKFGKDAVHMAAEENRQFAILGNTLNNLGLGFAAVSSRTFIENLALASGVANDVLTPAYQKLLIATGNVIQSQKDLQTAMDVSMATGKDLDAVTTAISKGYLGNTTALSRLGAGLDKTLLKTGNMDAIMRKLSATFAGSTATSVDTAAGSMARITEATRQATEAIGNGLIGAFTSLTAGGSITNAINDIVKFGTTIGNAIKQIGDMIAAIKRMPIVGSILNSAFKELFNTNPLIKVVTVLSKMQTNKNAPSALSAGELTGQSMLATAAQTKVTAQRLADAKATATVLANTKKTTAELKLQNQLKILGDPSTNLQKAELMAALQKDISAAARDQLNIQLLLLNATTQTGAALQKSVDDATILTQKALIAQGKVMLIDGSIVDLATAKNPFEGWDQYVQDALNAILKLKKEMQNLNFVYPTAPPTGLSAADLYNTNPYNIAPYTDQNTFSYPTAPPTGLSSSSFYSPVSLNITLDKGLIIDTTNAASAAGSQVTINRNQNQFV